MSNTTGVTFGYLMPKREPERELVHLSAVFERLLTNLTIVEPEPPSPPPQPAQPLLIEPELGRMSIHAHQAAEFRVWCICREITREGNGSGKVSKKALKAALGRFGVTYTRQHLNALLRAGNGLFWNLSRQTVYLRSRQYLAVKLAARHPQLVTTNKPGVRELYVPAAGCLEQWEAMLYAAWHTYREGPTISRVQLEQLFNRSQETLRRWEQNRLSHILTIRTNYAQLHDARAIGFTPPEDSFTYRAEVRTRSGRQIVERLAWRLPNTYSPAGIRQHPYKGQAAKVRTAINHHLTNPADERHGGTHLVKRYFDSGEAIRCYTQKHHTVGYLWRGETKSGVGIFEPSPDGFTRTRAGERVGS